MCSLQCKYYYAGAGLRDPNCHAVESTALPAYNHSSIIAPHAPRRTLRRSSTWYVVPHTCFWVPRNLHPLEKVLIVWYYPTMCGFNGIVLRALSRILDTIQEIFAVHVFYFFLVDNFDNPLGILVTVWCALRSSPLYAADLG